MHRDAVSAVAVPMSVLRFDGGACAYNLLMQFQTDLLGIPVVRSAVTKTTALGNAWLAALSNGVYKNTDELASPWRAERTFLPAMSSEHATSRIAEWEHAARQTVLK